MILKTVLVAVAAIVCYGIYHVTVELGYNVKYYKHHPGVCRRVAGADHGSEAIHVVSDGKAFIATGYQSPQADLGDYAERNNIHGGVLLFDFKNPSAGAAELTITSEKGFDVKKFRTHGLSVLEEKTKGEHLIYVVNHPPGSPDRIEKFRYVPKSKTMIHLSSIPVGDQLGLVNDLHVVAEDQFFVTNCAMFHSMPLALLENFVPFQMGGVFFYNSTGWLEVVPRLNLPNGIFLTRDEKLMYVLSFMDKTLLVYRRSESSSSTNQGWQLEQTIQLYGRGDNVQLSQSGDALLVGAHPSFGRLVQQLTSENPTAAGCPSSVVRLPLNKDGFVLEDDITEMFYDHGDLIAGASSAAIFDGQLLIGSVVDKLVHCQLDKK